MPLAAILSLAERYLAFFATAPKLTHIKRLCGPIYWLYKYGFSYILQLMVRRTIGV